MGANMNILFVCTGNTCRSPMAAAVLQHIDKGIPVKSAGIFATSGGHANPLTVEVLQRHGIACTHASQPVTEGLLDWADLVLTMTQSHQAHMQMAYPVYQDKVFTFIDYVKGEKVNVMDPYGGTLADYEKTYTMLYDVNKQLVQKINDQKGAI